MESCFHPVFSIRSEFNSLPSTLARHSQNPRGIDSKLVFEVPQVVQQLESTT